MRLATAVSKPVLHFMCGQNSCVSHRPRGDRVLAGSTLYMQYVQQRKRKQPHGRQQDRPKEGKRDRDRRNKQRHYRKTRWDSNPTVAPRGSTASERQAMSAGAARAATATASAAARRPRPTTARTTLPPSTDLKRKRSERLPGLHRWLALRSRTDGEDDRRTEREGSAERRRTETKGQSDDPDLIDDVV